MGVGAGYGFSAKDIEPIIANLLESAEVVTEGEAVEAGLAQLRSGGDFADGVIAHEGARLGAETFVTFDRKAARQLSERRATVRLLQSR